MIEETILQFLQEKLNALDPPVPVYMERPETLPAKYVILEKTGSGEENKIYSATFVVQSYAPSLYEAAALNDMLKSYMENLPDERDVSACDCNSDYNYTDPETRDYRYQAVFDITY